MTAYKKAIKLRQKSIRQAIKMFCKLGGYQMESTFGLKRYSQHRLIYSGIDLLDLQDQILKLPDRYLEAISQYGFDEPYSRQDFEIAITILSNSYMI